MADELAPTDTQQTVELDNGVVLSGMGGDLDALRIAFEDRAEERTGDPVEATATPDAPSTATPEKQPRGPKRYAQLTQEREDAKRERDAEKTRADAAEAKARELEARLAAPVITPPEVSRPAVPAAPIAGGEGATRAIPTEAEIGTKYPDYAAFILDTARWAAEQEAAKTLKTFDTLSQARIEADRASRSQADLASQAFARGRSVYPDFDAVLNTPEVTKILIPPDHQRAILSVPDPEHVMYELAKHPAKLAQIVGINDGVRLGLELAQLIPRAAVASPASTAPVVPTTHVPAPPQPVGASTRTTSPTAADLALKGGDDFDSSGYREKRAAELGRKALR